MARRINRAGIDLIKRWEGFRSKAYRCSAGVLTIGYGHTTAAGAPRVRSGMTVTRAEAERILVRDLATYERGVLSAIADVPCTDNQFAAMVSLCYNIGPGAFRRSSVAKHMRRGQPDIAATRFAAWNKAGGKVLRGLVRRRADEARLFNTPDGGRMPPSREDTAAAAGAAVSTGAGAMIAARQGIPGDTVLLFGLLAVILIALFLVYRSRKT